MSEETKHEHTAEAHQEEHGHMHGDVTVFRGKTYNLPVYTSVFLTLGVLTITEVLIAELINSEVLTIPLLMGIAVGKVGLVVWFYMHLNTDSRIFALTLIVPIIVGLLSALFLFAVPTGY